ncbi:MAG TPA: hypothetical protein EYO89_02675 [Candidatus Dadabacteria bacterium]|nr:hypothetical protein [Candidatus Dadabacteria bacterium]
MNLLERIAPKCQLYKIPKHKKGPVFAVQQIFDLIDDADETIVNYCDFGTFWDYKSFLSHTRKRSADGAVVAYKGFHPHMLKNPNYAFIKESEQWLINIQEKKPFTENKMNEYASNGTYYFSSGRMMKHFFDLLIKKDIKINDEYYVSMAYKLMAEEGYKVSIFEIEHMLQWGAPEDLEDYIRWSEIFSKICKKKSKKEYLNCVKLIPAAGEGKRFQDENFEKPKILTDVSGFPMIYQASACLPECKENYLAIRREIFENIDLDLFQNEYFSKFNIVDVGDLTEGQASTCEIALKGVDKNKECLVASSDNIVLFDSLKLQSLVQDKSIDSIVFTSVPNNKALTNPEMFGWVNSDNSNRVLDVAVKKPFKDKTGSVIIGIFYFRSVGLFFKALKGLKENKIKVNNEYYIDSMCEYLVRQNMNVYDFKIDHHISLGTPDEYRTFLYWQSYFHKAIDHEYLIKKDIYYNKDEIGKFVNSKWEQKHS